MLMATLKIMTTAVSHSTMKKHTVISHLFHSSLLESWTTIHIWTTHICGKRWATGILSGLLALFKESACYAGYNMTVYPVPSITLMIKRNHLITMTYYAFYTLAAGSTLSILHARPNIALGHSPGMLVPPNSFSKPRSLYFSFVLENPLLIKLSYVSLSNLLQEPAPHLLCIPLLLCLMSHPLDSKKYVIQYWCTAWDHRNIGRPESMRIVQTWSKIIWFKLSAMPFCSGVFREEIWKWIPCSHMNFFHSLVINSPLLLT